MSTKQDTVLAKIHLIILAPRGLPDVFKLILQRSCSCHNWEGWWVVHGCVEEWQWGLRVGVVRGWGTRRGIIVVIE
jgi:hypothetical protein